MSSSTTSTPLSYKDAGVDIDAGDALVERIKPLAKKTMREGVMAGNGGKTQGEQRESRIKKAEEKP